MNTQLALALIDTLDKTSYQENLHVFVMGCGSLFDEGIMHRLTLNSRLQVTSRKYIDDATFLKDMRLVIPDVVLLSEYNPLDFRHIIDLLPSVSSSVDLRVIVVRLYNNVIDVYDKSANQIAGQTTFRCYSIVASTWDDLFNLVSRKS